MCKSMYRSSCPKGRENGKRNPSPIADFHRQRHIIVPSSKQEHMEDLLGCVSSQAAFTVLPLMSLLRNNPYVNMAIAFSR